MIRIIPLLGSIVISSSVVASCQLLNSDNKPIAFLNDALSVNLKNNEQCASDVFVFRDQLKQAGLLL